MHIFLFIWNNSLPHYLEGEGVYKVKSKMFSSNTNYMRSWKSTHHNGETSLDGLRSNCQKAIYCFHQAVLWSASGIETRRKITRRQLSTKNLQIQSSLTRNTELKRLDQPGRKTQREWTAFMTHTLNDNSEVTGKWGLPNFILWKKVYMNDPIVA